MAESEQATGPSVKQSGATQRVGAYVYCSDPAVHGFGKDTFVWMKDGKTVSANEVDAYLKQFPEFTQNAEDIAAGFHESAGVLTQLELFNGELNLITKDIGVITAPLAGAQNTIGSATNMVEAMKKGDLVRVVQGAAKTLEGVAKTGDALVKTWGRVQELDQQFRVTEQLKVFSKENGLDNAVEGNEAIVLSNGATVVGVDGDAPDIVQLANGDVVDSHDNVTFGEHAGFSWVDGRLTHRDLLDTDLAGHNLLDALPEGMALPEGFVIPEGVDFAALAQRSVADANASRIAASLFDDGLAGQPLDTLAEGAIEEFIGDELVDLVAGGTSASARINNIADMSLSAVGYERGEEPAVDTAIDAVKTTAAVSEAVAQGGTNMSANLEALKQGSRTISDGVATIGSLISGGDDQETVDHKVARRDADFAATAEHNEAEPEPISANVEAELTSDAHFAVEIFNLTGNDPNFQKFMQEMAEHHGLSDPQMLLDDIASRLPEGVELPQDMANAVYSMNSNSITGGEDVNSAKALKTPNAATKAAQAAEMLPPL